MALHATDFAPLDPLKWERTAESREPKEAKRVRVVRGTMPPRLGDVDVRRVRALRLLNVGFAIIVEITGVRLNAAKPWCHLSGRGKRLRESAGEPSDAEIMEAAAQLARYVVAKRVTT